MLKTIKRLDKENTSLKETNKYQDSLKSAKVFLKYFKKYCKDWQQKTKVLKLKNNNLLAEIRRLNDDKENDNVNEKTKSNV